MNSASIKRGGALIFFAFTVGFLGMAIASRKGPVEVPEIDYSASSFVLVLELGGKSSGTVYIELYPGVAPKNVQRIIELAREGAYDGIAFHQVFEGILAQTGDVQYGAVEGYDPAYVGRGSSDKFDVEAEFSDIPFVKGVVAMFHGKSPDSANSQFFIVLEDQPNLDGKYTAIGRVVSGMVQVSNIQTGGRGNNGVVLGNPDYIKRAYIEEY